MLVVNFPGSWGAIYPQLDHAIPFGLHLADLVFPAFLWIVGFSYSLRQTSKDLKFELSRFALIAFWGLFLNLFPQMDWDNFRILGVLQRIGIASLVLFVYGSFNIITEFKL